MKRINVDLFELQAFAKLAELRSFRAAAEELALSGSALSRLIARVEDKLGTRLFDRDTRNVALTPQGEALQHLTDRILNEAATALTEFDAYLAARRGRLVLAGLPSVTASLLPRIVARFVALHPDVEVSIIDALSEGVLAAVLEGRADLGFTAGALDSSGRLSFQPLVEDEFMAVGRPMARWTRIGPMSGENSPCSRSSRWRGARACAPSPTRPAPKLAWLFGPGSRWRIWQRPVPSSPRVSGSRSCHR